MATRWTVPYKKAVLEFARLFGNTADTCREFGVSRSTFYEWKNIVRERGTVGLVPQRPIALHHPRALQSVFLE